MKNGRDEFEAYWPSWPDGVQGENLTDVHVGCGFGDLAELLWGRVSQFQMDFNTEVGFVDFQRTEWIDDYENLPCLPGGFDWAVEEVATQDQQGATDFSGKLRKVRSHNGGGAAFLGQFFKTEELQRCREFIAGRKLVMEACVCTTAPFCDRFRVICRYDMERVRDDTCRLKIDFHIAYVQKVNGMTKVFMEKGARGGLIKNFEIYVQTLSNFVSLLPPEEVEAIRESSPVESPPTGSSQELSGRESDPSERSTFVRWEGFVCPSFQKLIAPKLDSAKAAMFDKPPSPTFLAPFLSTACTSQLLCILIFVVVAKFILIILGGLSHALGLPSSGNIVIRSMSRIFDPPDGVGEVFTAAIVLEVVHWLLTTVGDLATEASRDEIPAQAVQSSDPSSSIVKDTNTESQSSLATANIVGASSSSRGENGSTGVDVGSTPVTGDPMTSSSESLVENVEAGSSGKDEREQLDTDFVEPPPSFIENTISFFRLGIVASALAVDIAISGMKNKQDGYHELKNDKDAQDKDPIPADAPKEEDPTIVVEGIFENERLQPFRGWGHTWPGHFLPTDKCRHWSVQTPHSDNLITSMHFDEIESKLPDGWIWDDASWKIDLSGRDADAVDPDGWQYGVDFGWLKFPPEAGNAKRPGKFIRRRRWIRSRSKVPQSETPNAKTTDDKFATSLVDSISFGDDQSTMPGMKPWGLARVSCDSAKAMSEMSYFSGKPISSFMSTDLANQGDKLCGPPNETMHRRHSSGATTMERYFSVEECSASLIQSFGESFNRGFERDNNEAQACLDQKTDQCNKDQVTDRQDGLEWRSDEQPLWGAPRNSCPEAFLLAGEGSGKSKSLDLGGGGENANKNPMARLADNLDNLKRMGVGGEGEETKKAWSDSEMATPRRVKDSGFGRFLIPSFQFREKVDGCGMRVNLAFGTTTARPQQKKLVQRRETAPTSKISTPLHIDLTEDTCWLSMEGGKWVENCLSPRKPSSPSPSLKPVPKMKPDREDTRATNVKQELLQKCPNTVTERHPKEKDG